MLFFLFLDRRAAFAQEIQQNQWSSQDQLIYQNFLRFSESQKKGENTHQKTVLLFGDSLSAGYGMNIIHSWPTKLKRRLEDKVPAWHLVNLSISGETTGGGLSRLRAAIKRFNPDAVIIALGANDGLRGIPVSEMKENLEQMIQVLKNFRSKVMLIGMRLPPNYGKSYTESFFHSFSNIAEAEKIAYLPFLLSPIANNKDYFQADGLHPTEQAQDQILEHVWPSINQFLN